MEEHLFPSVHSIEGVQIASIGSRDADKRSRLGGVLGASTFERWEDAIEVNELDGVLVAGPPMLNSMVVSQCIDMRLPVLCEKPCAATTVEVRNLLDRAQECGAIVQVGYNFRRSTPFENIKGLTKRFGQIIHLDVEFNSNKPSKEIWNTSSVLEAFLLAVGVHPIELISEVCGPERKVDCNIVDRGNGWLKIFLNVQSGGTSVRVAAGNQSQTLEVSFRALFESGDVAVSNLREPHKVSILPSSSTKIESGALQYEKATELSLQQRNLARDRYGLGYEAQVRDFLAMIELKEPNFHDLYTSVQAHQIIDKIQGKNP
jgi:predicted dehydrogenase